MSTMNISLPDDMKIWVEDEVKNGGFASASEFFRQLVREAKAQKEHQTREARLEELLLEGLESGEAMPVTKEWWDSFRADLKTELDHRNSNG